MRGQPLRRCQDLDMHATDRPVSSCAHATDYCRANCYNLKFYRRNKRNLCARDKDTARLWLNPNYPQLVAAQLSRARAQTKRARFKTRGEALSSYADIARVKAVCEATPATTWWLPTRAWRNPFLRSAIRAELWGVRNLRLMACIDPSNSAAEVTGLEAEGWSTMFFGNDEAHPLGSLAHKCGKTWRPKNHAPCSRCRKGCFLKRQVHVWLRKH